MPIINAAISPSDRAAGNNLAYRAIAPSSDCSVTAVVRLSDSAPSAALASLGSTCSINIETGAAAGGTAVAVSGLGQCGILSIDTKIELSPIGAQSALAFQTQAASGSGTSAARARITVGGFYPIGNLESDVRGRWRHTHSSATPISLTYPLAYTVLWLDPDDGRASTTYGLSPPSVEATNVIGWFDAYDDERLRTSVTLTMLAGGGYHCSHSATAYPAWDTLGVAFNVTGECFP